MPVGKENAARDFYEGLLVDEDLPQAGHLLLHLSRRPTWAEQAGKFSAENFPLKAPGSQYENRQAA